MQKNEEDNRQNPKDCSIRVALAGNPNSGKTSLFNALTGARQNVGNYPGVTVEKRTGVCIHEGQTIEVWDLPGTYSLTSFSPEEKIAQTEILEGDFDVVVVVVDSTVLHRSLVLLVQVMLAGAKPVLCLNMSDEAKKAGQKIDVPLMEALLGFPVVETIGHRGKGIDELVNAIQKRAQGDNDSFRLVLGQRLDEAISEIRKTLDDTIFKPELHGWVATKLLVGERPFVQAIEDSGNKEAIVTANIQKNKIESETGMDISLFVTQRFFGFVDGLLKEVITTPSRTDSRKLSEAIDSLLVHRVLGLPIFAGVMFVIFWLTFTVGEPPMNWIDHGLSALAGYVSSIWPEGSQPYIRSLVLDGIIGGVGGVLVFFPNILLLFLGLAFLEDTGYMARAAFLMDRVMHRFGLHGKSFLPLLTGFGCTIPAIMATRTLENERDRLTTMLILPLMSCGARLPIWLLLIPAFFTTAWRAPMLWLIYAQGILLALLFSLLLRKTVLKGEDAPFVMELPPYRMPTMKAVFLKMTGRSWLYVRKAGTVILGISIAMWFITSFPKPTSYEVDSEIAAGRIHVYADSPNKKRGNGNNKAAQNGDKETNRNIEKTNKNTEEANNNTEEANRNTEEKQKMLSRQEVQAQRAAEDLKHSIAGRLGRFMEPVLLPLGFDWRIATGMIGAFAAKEVFVAQMGIVYSIERTEENTDSIRENLRRDYSWPVGLSMILFLLIGTPCMATFAITRKESGSIKWALLQFGGLTLTAYILAMIAYQIGSLFI